MTKKRKDGKIFNCYLSAEIYEQLHDYCVKNDYTMTRVTEKAIEYYLKTSKTDK